LNRSRLNRSDWCKLVTKMWMGLAQVQA